MWQRPRLLTQSCQVPDGTQAAALCAEGVCCVRKASVVQEHHVLCEFMSTLKSQVQGKHLIHLDRLRKAGSKIQTNTWMLLIRATKRSECVSLIPVSTV